VCSSSSTIHKGSVKDIAFVFHINILENDHPNCAGMSRVFFTRHCYDERNRLQEVACQNHVPFSSVALDSYPSRIWHAILDVKDNVEKHLNDKKQYQTCKKMVLMSCSIEAWYFLYVNLVRSGALVVQFKWKNTKKYMHCDLSLSTHSARAIQNPCPS
jgi:hypothetical protein